MTQIYSNPLKFFTSPCSEHPCHDVYFFCLFLKKIRMWNLPFRFLAARGKEHGWKSPSHLAQTLTDLLKTWCIRTWSVTKKLCLQKRMHRRNATWFRLEVVQTLLCMSMQQVMPMESAHVSATVRLCWWGHRPKLSLQNVGVSRLSGKVFLHLLLMIHSFGRPLSQFLAWDKTLKVATQVLQPALVTLHYYGLAYDVMKGVTLTLF